MTVLTKVYAEDLTVGLFVAKVEHKIGDNTHFPKDGFIIDTNTRLKALKNHALAVYVNFNKSDASLLDSSVDQQGFKLAEEINYQSSHLKMMGQNAANTLIEKGSANLIPQSRKKLNEELHSAAKLHIILIKELTLIYKKLNTLDHTSDINVSRLTKLAQEIIVSVRNNRDALLLETRVSQQTAELQNIAIRTAIQSILIGIIMDKKEPALVILAMTAMLAPAGYVGAPLNLIRKTLNRSPEEQINLKKILLSFTPKLKLCQPLKGSVIRAVESHLEHWNGKGYPGIFSMARIPFTSQAVGIALQYEMLQSNIFNNKALLPQAALTLITRLRERQFSENMVDCLACVVSIYPTGILVKLKSGESAMVLEQRHKSKLRPYVVIVTDRNCKKLSRGKPLDLSLNTEYSITQQLDFDIELAKIAKEEINPQQGRGWFSQIFNFRKSEAV